MDFNLHYVKALYGPDGPKAQKGVPLSNQIAVAGYIAMRVVDWGSGDNGWAAIGTIADALGMSPKTTGNAINALEKQGWLDIKVRRNRPSTYKLTIPTVTQPLPTGVESTEQNLPADVKSTEQPLPTGVNLGVGSVNFAPRSVTVTDDLYNPIKNLVVDAHESAAPTTTQQVEEELAIGVVGEHDPGPLEGRLSEDAIILGHHRPTPPQQDKEREQPDHLDDLCPDGLTQWMLDAFEQYGFPLGIASATSLMVQLRGYGLTLRQIQAYITERLIDAEMHDKTPRASYLIGDAPAWLKARQPRQTHPDDLAAEAKRREEAAFAAQNAREAREAAERRTPEEQAAMEIYYKQLGFELFGGGRDEVN